MADTYIEPTPEQCEAYKQIALATLSMARFSKYCAGLPKESLFSHPTQPRCLVLPGLATEFTLVKLADQVALAARPHHTQWLKDWPFDFVAISANELFFVSKTFTWLNTTVEAMALSIGTLNPNPLLSDLAQQRNIGLFQIDLPGVIDSVTPLHLGWTVPLYHTVAEVPLLGTRAHHDAMHARDETFTSAKAAVSQLFAN